MPTADDLIAWYREDHPGMVEVARVITEDAGTCEILLLDTAARAEDDAVTITQIGVTGDGEQMIDRISISRAHMTQLALAWLARQGYAVTPPATA